MKKISLESTDLPTLTEDDDGTYRISYGHMRGSQWGLSKEEAHEIMLNHLQSRIHSCAKELDALCRLQRKIIKGQQ